MPPTDNGTPNSLQSILDPLQIDKSVKANVWDAFHGSQKPEDFQKALDATSLDKGVKSKLWDLRFGSQQAQPAQVAPAPQAQPGLLDRGLSYLKDEGTKAKDVLYGNLVAPFVEPYKEGYRDPVNYLTRVGQEFVDSGKESYQNEKAQTVQAAQDLNAAKDPIQSLDAQRRLYTHAVGMLPIAGPLITQATGAAERNSPGELAGAGLSVAVPELVHPILAEAKTRGLDYLTQDNRPTSRPVPKPDATPAKALTPEVPKTDTNVPVNPSKVSVSTDSMGIRWASNGIDKVSVPKSVSDAEIETYAGPKLQEQAQIKSQLFKTEAAPATEPIASQETQGANYRPQYTYKPSEKASVMSAPRPELGPEFDAAEAAHDTERSKAILRDPNATEFDRQVAQRRLDEGHPLSPSDTPQGAQASPQTDFRGLDSPMRPWDPNGDRFQTGGNGQRYDLSRPEVIDPEKAPDTQSAPIEQTAQTQSAPTPSEPTPQPAARGPLVFPLEDFSGRMSTVEKAQRMLKRQDLSPIQQQQWEDFLNKQRQGIKSSLNNWFQSDPDHSLAEQELERTREQAQSIRDTVSSNSYDPDAPKNKSAWKNPLRQEMEGRTAFRKVTLEGQGPEGTDLHTWERMGSDVGVDAREAFHEMLGDKTRTQLQVEKPGVEDEGTRQRAQARIDEIKKALADRVREMGDDPSTAILSKEEQLAKALKEGNYAGELKDLRSIVGRKSEYQTATNLSGRGTLGKGKAQIDEAGVVRPAGKVGEITLDYARQVFGSKLRKIPSETEFLQRASELEQRAQLLDNVVKKAKAKKGIDPNQAGFVGETRKKARFGPDDYSADSLEKEAKKFPELTTWRITPEHPAGNYGFLIPDHTGKGNLWVEGESGLEHSDMARRLLKSKDYDPQHGPVNAILDSGGVRKASKAEYQIHRPGTRQISAIEMSMITDGKYQSPVIIDAITPAGRLRALRINGGWEDLASEVDRIKRTDPAWQGAQAGYVSGTEIMGGTSVGMATGAAIGHAIAGTPGAIVGGSVGFIVGGSIPAILRSPIVRSVLTSLGDEVRGLGYSSLSGSKQIATDLVHFLSPRMGASNDALTTIYAMKGDVARAAWDTGKLLDVYRQHIEALPKDAQIDFIDRIKQGQPQASPELDELAKTIRAVDQADYEALKKYRPGLPFLENHFRLLYETIPGKTDEGFKGWLGKRPLQGSKGMLNQHVYDTLSDAMANGGKPVTTNPIDMFLIGHVDAQRFIAAQGMWETAKDLGLREFVKLGDKASAGMTRLDDSIAKVYFPAESGEGLVNPGEHYVEENFGRLLNNHLSKDYIRANVLGKTIVDLKNIATGWELFGPFHGVAMSIAATSGNFALGMERAFNLGLRKGDLGEIVRGGKEMAGSILGSRSSFLDGRNLQEFGDAINRYKHGDAEALKDFSNSPSGQKFLQKYPDAEGLLGDAFMGGLNMKLSDDMRSNITRSMMESFRNNEYIQGTVKAPFAALNSSMRPLFDNYIPRLKLGMFMKDMSLQLKDRGADILSGKTTREEVARRTVDRIENTFGEMNFDNLFWNKTFKTSMQMLYRSASWRLGTLRLLKDAVKNQAGNILEGVKEGELPRLDPNFGYLAAETLVVGGLSAVIMKSLANKTPQNLTDLLHPQTGDKDSKGKPVRVNVPAYMSRDIPNILSEPSGIFKYATGGNSVLMQRALESWNNKDFSGAWVANPNDPTYKQFAAKVIHLLPSLMIMNTMDRLDAEGASKDRKLLALAGFSPAAKSVDMSAAELQAQARLVAHMGGEARDPQSIAKAQTLNRLTAAFQNKRPAGEIFREGIKNGTLSPDDLGKIATKMTTPLVVQLTQNPKMNIEDVLGVYRLATPQEKNLLRPVILSKLSGLEKIPQERRGQVWQQVREVFQGAHAQ